MISAGSCLCTSLCLEYTHVRQYSPNATSFFPTAQLFLGGQYLRWATGVIIIWYTDGCVCKPDNHLGTDDIKSLHYGHASVWSLGLCSVYYPKTLIPTLLMGSLFLPSLRKCANKGQIACYCEEAESISHGQCFHNKSCIALA